jgi:hypothetical protein
MKSCVVTQAFGDGWLKILELTRPRMEDYCKRTEQDFISIEKPLAEPVQYTKSVLGNLMATKGYEKVTFFDGMASLARAFGYKIEPRFYVNTGVFVATNKMPGIFAQPPLGLFPNHFAEQTWMNVMAHLCDLDLQELDPSFNCMTSVESHFGLDRYNDAYIIHYAGQSGDLNKLADQIKEDDKKLDEESR